ncbi:hypothetical protein FB451DRAFT_1165359 [Mycena latifolia]|nr:hypothetical protein FB451DRAFT_1165359 [Mycena latifolia]
MSLWNFTIDDTSPFLTYTDGSNSGLTKGWEPWYTDSGFISENGQGGTGDSYHITSLAGASVNLEFYGTAVYFYGTANGSYDTSLDNAAYTYVPDTPDLLLAITDLKEGTHSVSNEGSLHVSFLIDFSETPTEAFYDNTDTTTLKYSGDWAQSTAPGIPNATVTHPWQETFAEGASVSMDMGAGAVGVSLWGMANWGNWLYAVSIDGGAENSYNGSTFWKVPDALLFYEGGLDPTKNHTIKLTNTTPKMKLALNSIRVYHIESTQNTTVAPASVHSSPHSAVSAGVIAGPIIGAVFIALLAGFLWWRSRRNRSRALTSRDLAQSDAYTDRSPHRPLFPSTGYATSTSMTALTATGHSPTYSVPATQISGPPGSTVMTWGAAPYRDDDQNAPSHTGISSSAYSAHSPSSAHSDPPTSVYAPSSDGPAPVLVGKMRAPPPPPPPVSTGLDAPDVDRLIELIAQRIDQGRGPHDETSPPEYRG